MESIDFMAWVVLPVLIFIARLLDVSLATLRHILIFRGMKRIVPVFAFVEVTIWLLAISQVMNNLDNIACFLAWAFGFSAGTYIGMVIEERLALGYQLVRVIATGEPDAMRESLKSEGYGVTSIGARGSQGSVEIFLVVSARKRLRHLLSLLNGYEPRPFFTVEDVRSVGTHWMPSPTLPGALAFEGSVKKK